LRSRSFPRRGAAAAAVPAALLLLTVTACASGSKAPGRPVKHQPAQAPATISISPANGSQHAAPDQGITVTAAHGAVSHITVLANGNPVSGTLSQGGAVWHSQWALSVSQRYTVTATATSTEGHRIAATSTFRTLTPAQTFRTQIFEGYHQTYGVGMPIKLTFSRPITNKAAVERSLEVRTSQPVVGAWHWDGSQQLDFRPQAYWPAGTQVSFTGHLDGVQGAPGVYGFHTLTQSFAIGASVIVVANTATHHMSLYYNGRRIHYWPISTGRPGDNTPNGSYLTIEKANPVDMKGPGYNILVPWSVRFTWSGDYLHDAYWSVGEQGFTNVSHGCVNMTPADAELYYKMAVPGDPVTITGSPRAGTWDNGWTDWFLSWPQLLSGSALHEAVLAGPDGSGFVSPATLPPSPATSPLQIPAPDNASAA
jgi:lipoprotein-anchoring transpeptidase ErfK/SrfK